MPANCVLRRIGDRDLYIGNSMAGDPANHDHAFDHVLTVSRHVQAGTTHHHPLVDGPGNPHSAVVDALDTARDLYSRDGSLLIHCQAGISRSATTIAATLAAEEDLSFRDAVSAIREHRPDASPKRPLRAHAHRYLDTLGEGRTDGGGVEHCVDCETPIDRPHVEGSFDDRGDPIHPECADWIL